MAEWGLRIWDKDGNDINTGFVRVLVIGTASLSSGQISGSWSFTIPSGYVIGYLFQNTSLAGTTNRRRFNISGGNVTLSAANGNYGVNTEPSTSGNVIFYVRKP